MNSPLLLTITIWSQSFVSIVPDTFWC